jgi:hypothetical protein
MSIEITELDQMQLDYKTAVDDWVNAIRTEEALASSDHSVAEVDLWEQAGFSEEAFRNKAKAAKKKYEAALRLKFFNFS